MKQFDNEWIKKQGIVFKNSIEENDFLIILNMDLKKRFMEEVISCFSDWYNEAEDSTPIIHDWEYILEELKNNEARYRVISESVWAKMAVEITMNRDKILPPDSEKPDYVYIETPNGRISYDTFRSICEEKLGKVGINGIYRNILSRMGINTIGVLLFTPEDTIKSNELAEMSDSMYEKLVKYLRKKFNIE